MRTPGSLWLVSAASPGLPCGDPGTTLRAMRWAPQDPVCAGCRFDWSLPATEAIAIVAGCPDAYVGALAGTTPRNRRQAMVGGNLLQASASWTATASTTPLDLTASHDLFGELAAVDIVRRNAHEVHHHLLDIAGRCSS